MSIIQGHAKSSGVSAFYPTTIDQSLRFEDGDNAYLNWTPASAGNRKTWTWSGWVKRGNLAGQAGEQALFVCRSGSESTYTRIIFRTDDELWVHSNTGLSLNTSAVYRDPSAWYHIVVALDTTQATAANRCKIYVNGEQVTAFATETYPTQNTDLAINRNVIHTLGVETANSTYWDGYLAEVHFTDGTAYTADDFGELKSSIWVPKEVSVTYGTNGFYLPFNEDVTVEGFNTVTYRGTGSTRSVTGVGFSPDLVWIKRRNGTTSHNLFDSVRGAGKPLFPNLTNAEVSDGRLTSFDSDGFSLDSDSAVNASGASQVAWCWDAGSGSPASNTDGSITSSVKANTAYGFSVVTYTGSAGGTVGHGLNTAPELIIAKSRTVAGQSWVVYTESQGKDKYLLLESPNGVGTYSNYWGSGGVTSSVFGVGPIAALANNNGDLVAYCFHSVSGYSDFGSYTGNGSSTGPTITTGFKPAFVMVKSASTNDAGNGNWIIYDNTRSPNVSSITQRLYADLSNAEGTNALYDIEFTDTGFQLKDGTANIGSNTNGTTYIYMAFADTRDAAFWLDESGNDNDWTPNNLENSDIVPDSSTNNFAVCNAVEKGSSITLAEGNLKVTNGANQSWQATASTVSVSSGKWYCEVRVNVANQVALGIAESSLNVQRTPAIWETAQGYSYFDTTGDVRHNNASTSYGGATYTAGDIISIALDLDAGTLVFYKNGVSQGTAATGLTGEWKFVFAYYTTNNSGTSNFGQDSTFAGNVTAGGNSDANGIGDFKYAPPSGYLALCTSNLPNPAIDPAQDNVPEDHFDVLASAGISSYSGLSFAPDFLWNKIRTAVGSHVVADSIRGDDKRLRVESTEAESTLSGYFNLTSNGFTTTYYNSSGEDYVYFFWKAGGTGVANTDGSITSTVSANTDAGFSIVSYTGNATSGATVGHGLNSAPEMVIVKNRDDGATHWHVYHQDVGNAKYLLLSLTNAATTASNRWNNTSPSSSVVTLGNHVTVNGSSDSIIAFCFHSVDGFSKMGSFVGNGNADGTFVYTGFRPKWVMIKQTTTAENWIIIDAERSTYNLADDRLIPNLTNAEGVDNGVDILSNGFKCRSSNTATNESGQTHIYLAFAEQPFKYSNGR